MHPATCTNSKILCSSELPMDTINALVKKAKQLKSKEINQSYADKSITILSSSIRFQSKEVYLDTRFTIQEKEC